MSDRKNNSHEPETFREQFLIDPNVQYETLGRYLSSLAACITGFRHHAITTIALLFYQKYKQKSIRGAI